MALTYAPNAPWHLAVLAAAAVTVLVLLLRGWRVMPARWRLLIGFFSIIGSGLLVLAAYNPVLSREPEPEMVHLSIVVDVSDSVLRSEGGWAKIQKDVARFLAESLESVAEETVRQGEASIVTFRGTAASQEMPLSELVASLQRLSRDDFAGGQNSNIGAGLERARRLIEQDGGRGAILLVSDGNDTEGEALRVAEEIARLGIPISIFPVSSDQPEISLTSINLPHQVDAGTETLLRGVVWNQSQSDARLRLSIQQNPGLDAEDPGLFGPPLMSSGGIPPLSAGAYGRLRQPLAFQGVGLQIVDVKLQDVNEAPLHQRRFFTYVHKPVELLAIGGDNRWVAAVPQDAAVITQITAEQIGEVADLTRYDGLVISSVPVTAFAAEQLERIAHAVEDDGLGLMVINGDHSGADDEAETVLRSYFETPIDPLLPVSTDPKVEFDEPPARNVAILIDRSGSMAGWPIAKAKEIATYIVDEFLRPQDVLHLITFTCGAQQLVNGRAMDERGKQETRSQINSIGAGGGTCPEAALTLLTQLESESCGLILLSDGEFAHESVRQRPDCRTTVFAVRDGGIPTNSPLYELADPFAAGPSFDPAGVNIQYFEPEPRDKFFEPGDYTPLTMAQTVALADFPPVPEIPLQGTAISYRRDNAELIAVRPKFTDPVLVYGTAGKGYVGVFTTALTEAWIENTEGKEAIQDWLLRIVPYAARDRYDFNVTDDGQTMQLQVALRSEGGGTPDVDVLTVQVELGEDVYGVAMVQDLHSPATFSGLIQVPRSDKADVGRLVIAETGPDALARPQRIPILIPPAGAVDSTADTEAQSYGLNSVLLQQIAEVSGGHYMPQDGQGGARFFRAALPLESQRFLWPWAALAGALSYFVAILLQRLGSR